jgi:hypothetical protein
MTNVLFHRVRAILDSLSVRYALIGGWALGLRGYVRLTTDTDFLTVDRRVLNADVWAELTREGIHVDPRKGDFDDPLGGVVHIGSKPDEVDVVVGKWKFEQRIIERSEPVVFHGETVPVPTTSDLILLKLAAGGAQDYADAYQLLKFGSQAALIEAVESEIETLPQDAQKLWQRLLAEITPP